MTEPPPPPPPGGGYPPPPPTSGGGYPPPPPSPPGGGYPPPPGGGYQAPQGGYQPPQGGYSPPQGGYSPQAPGFGGAPSVAGGLPQDAYTPWLTRVLAYLIDYIPSAVVGGIGYGIAFATGDTVCVDSSYGYGGACTSSFSALGAIVVGLTFLLVLAYVVWNFGYRQGTTGSSIGKSVMKFKIVSEKTGQPIGFGMSLVRELIYFVFSGVCFILALVTYLFPLWDQKRQTLVDKVISTVALPIDPQAGPPGQPTPY